MLSVKLQNRRTADALRAEIVPLLGIDTHPIIF
jgi:hypothetical protein